MNEEDYKKFASETMVDVSKLLITLASGFFVLSTALINVLSEGKDDPISSFWSLVIAWFCLIVSIGGGVIALGGIATSAHDDKTFDVDAAVTNWALRIQQIAFLLAFVFVAFFAIQNK